MGFKTPAWCKVLMPFVGRTHALTSVITRVSCAGLLQAHDGPAECTTKRYRGAVRVERNRHFMIDRPPRSPCMHLSCPRRVSSRHSAIIAGR